MGRGARGMRARSSSRTDAAKPCMKLWKSSIADRRRRRPPARGNGDDRRGDLDSSKTRLMFVSRVRLELITPSAPRTSARGRRAKRCARSRAALPRLRSRRPRAAAAISPRPLVARERRSRTRAGASRRRVPRARVDRASPRAQTRASG
jgi:hypothetical protein